MQKSSPYVWVYQSFFEMSNITGGGVCESRPGIDGYPSLKQGVGGVKADQV